MFCHNSPLGVTKYSTGRRYSGKMPGATTQDLSDRPTTSNLNQMNTIYCKAVTATLTLGLVQWVRH